MNIGYFFIDGLNGGQRADMLRTCIKKLTEAGAYVTSCTFDAVSANFSMANNLGCDLYSNPPKTHFPHPEDSNKHQDIYVILDAAHMLKLVRNTLGLLGILIDPDGNAIQWEFIEKLLKRQQIEGLHFGNKITELHIQFRKKPMNVKLAAQVFSESVADGLTYFLKKGDEEFVGCEPTIKFIRIINNVFDVLNSISLSGYKYKKALFGGNFQSSSVEISKGYKYIKDLKIKEGNNLISILHADRRWGFLGFMITIRSIISLYIYKLRTIKPQTKIFTHI